jgi:hypothetical protein
MTFTDKWKAGEDSIGEWLSSTLTGNIVKSFAAPVVLFVGTEVGNWDLPLWLVVGIVGAVPTLTNAVNPADTRFGIKPNGAPDVVQD